MREYYDKELLLGTIADNCYAADDAEEYEFWDRAWKFIRSFPAADVAPVKRGKWVDMGDFISCSSCNATILKEFESYYGKATRLDARTNYCPNCGARMEEATDV
jgi:hypothetical protein